MEFDQFVYERPNFISKQKVLKERKFSAESLNDEEIDLLINKFSIHIEDVAPLSKTQEWFFYQQDVVSPSFYIQSLFKVNGIITPKEFSEHINQIVANTPILRTVFLQTMRRGLQVVLKGRTVEITYHSLENLHKDDLNQTIENIMDADRRRGFDITKERLLRISVLRTGLREYAVLVAQPQIIADGWDVGSIFQGIFEEQVLKYGVPTLPQSKKFSFSEYLKIREKQDCEPAFRYWGNLLNSLPDGPDLPGYKKSYMPYKQELIVATMDSMLTDLIYKISNHNRQQVTSILQCAWGLMLQKINQCKDVYFNVVLSNRSASSRNIEDVANIINIMPVRITDYDTIQVNEMFKKQYMQNVLSQPFSYCDISELEKVVGYKEKVKHFLNFHSLLVKADSYTDIEVPFGATAIAVHSFDSKGSILGVYFRLKDDKLIAEFAYDKNSIEESKINVLKEGFIATLRSLVKNTDKMVGDVTKLVNLESLSLKESRAVIHKEDMISLIKEVDLFKDMSRIEIGALLQGAKYKYYLENDVILSEGMMQKYMYIVMRGNVEVSRKANNGWTSSLAIIGEKGIVNYNAADEDERSCVRVEALEGDVVVVGIPILNLKKLVASNEKIMWKFINHLTQEVNKYQKLWINE